MTMHDSPEGKEEKMLAGLPPIDRDEHMDRTYIPIPGGYEIQTKGKGSSFRIAKTDGGGERWIIAERMLHKFFEQMAMDIRAAFEAQASKYSATIARLEKKLGDLQKVHFNDVYDYNEKLAAAELSNKQLREAMNKAMDELRNPEDYEIYDVMVGINQALAQPLSTEALDAYVAKLIPHGWKVVPINMTDEMYEASDQATQYGSIEDGWKAMLESAPLPPSPDKKD